MPNNLSFGQRIAVVWRELVEHLNYLSTTDDDSDDRDAADEIGGDE